MMCKQGKQKINMPCIIFAMFCLLNIFFVWFARKKTASWAAFKCSGNKKNPARGGVLGFRSVSDY